MAQSGIYKSKAGEEYFLKLYDEALEELGGPFEDKMVETRFGQTHVLMLGPVDGPPLVMFHGGNSINAETLHWYLPLAQTFRIYAPDTIGHPGKSDQVRLPIHDLSYGEWASDVIDALGLESAPCLGSSYGASIILYLAAHKPEQISKAVLVVPGSIAMGSKLKMIGKIVWPMLMYKMFGGEQRALKAIQPIAMKPPKTSIKVIQGAFDHLKMADLLPNIKAAQIKDFSAPTMVVAAENDIFFPAAKVIPKAKQLIPNLERTEVIKGSTHMPPAEKLGELNQWIEDFLTAS